MVPKLLKRLAGRSASSGGSEDVDGRNPSLEPRGRAGRKPSALRVGEDARVEERRRDVRPVRRPRGSVVRLRRLRVGGGRQHGAEHPANVQTVQPRPRRDEAG